MAETITAHNSKRLAKNTLLLYVRTLIVMAISLFTSRVILDSLGVEDYGTYNVVGGFVAMFSLVSGTLVKSTQRFLNVELGKTCDSNPNKIFCTAFGIHVLLAAILIILFETIGLWYIYQKMNIPDGRLSAAIIVFQCSAASFLIHILTMPYNAVVIAFERMKTFAYITLFDAIAKLAISYSLYICHGDRLEIYGILMLVETLILGVLYFIYCRKNFPVVTKLRIIKEKKYYLNQVGFASYTFVGSAASIFATQGVNLVLNYFSGVTVNAARGLAVQVQSAVTKFVTDFTTALNPQITKTYSSGEIDRSLNMAYKGARFSYYLMMLLSTPLLYKTTYILSLWLKDFPEYTIIFVRLTLVYNLITSLSHTLTTVILASGNIKTNALIIGGLRLLILPLSYMALKLGYEPYYVYYVTIIIDIISLFTRLYIVKYLTGSSMTLFLKDVLYYSFAVTILVIPVNYYITGFFSDTIVQLLLYCLVSVIISGIIIMVIGMNKRDRKTVIEFVCKKLHIN